LYYTALAATDAKEITHKIDEGSNYSKYKQQFKYISVLESNCEVLGFYTSIWGEKCQQTAHNSKLDFSTAQAQVCSR